VGGVSGLEWAEWAECVALESVLSEWSGVLSVMAEW
jgi:hypothetical protein